MVKYLRDGSIEIKIDAVTADIICRRALREYAVRHGLDDKEQFGVVNWHWHLGNKREGVIFNGKKERLTSGKAGA